MCLLFLLSFTIYIQDSSEAGNLIYIELYNLVFLSRRPIRIFEFTCGLHTGINMQTLQIKYSLL